jgi:saccharopepsin
VRGIWYSTLGPDLDEEMVSSLILSLLLLPFANAADGIHRMKLKKTAQTAPGSAEEAALLAQKYGGQLPLAGAGGFGRKFANPPPENTGDLVWTQRVVADGGHGVPLSSTSPKHIPDLRD